MKKALLLFIVTGFLLSCSKNNEELVGKWKLVELLADPGNGSGVFHPVSSNKVLEFYSDGTVKSNGAICLMDRASDTPSTGWYSLTDSTITGDDCKDASRKITFEHTGPKLILNYPCIEPCRGKYRKQ